MFQIGSILGMVDIKELLNSFGVDWHLLVIQSLNFLVVAALLYRFGFKRVVAVMSERNDKIEAGLLYADKMRQEMSDFENNRAARLDSVRQAAEEIIQSARDDAKRISDEEKEKSSQLAESMLIATQKEIAFRRDHAMQEARSEIGSLVVDVAKTVLAKEMTAKERTAYVSAAEQAVLSGRLA